MSVLNLPDPNELRDLAYLLYKEKNDLAVVEDTLVELLDLAVEPEAVVPPPGGQLLEIGTDVLIRLWVRRAVQGLATPELRKSWLEARRESIRQMGEWIADGPKRREARKAARQARRA